MADDDGAGTRTELAGTRTELAVERTVLAWWRTSLTALAVALAVGRVLPELAPKEETWPYVAIGLGFVVYAIGLMVYGSVRHIPPGERMSGPMLLATGGGVLLGLASGALIAAG